MALTTLDKQPWESLPFNMNMAKSLPSGESIASVDSVTAAAQNLVSGSSALTVGATSYSGQVAQVVLSGGTDGELYLVTFRVIGENGSQVEGEGYMQVRELP